MSEQIELFFKLLSEGNNVKTSCELTGLNPKSVSYYYKKYNIYPVNKFSKYTIKGDYFDNIDSEQKAYFLGLIIADGCIILEKNKINNLNIAKGLGYRLSLGFQEEDGYILDSFSKELGIDKPLKTSNNQDGVVFRKTQRRFRFNNKHLVNTLINKHNILPRKTYHKDFVFPMENIPVDLIRHFVRGFFDGDGSISFYKTKKTIYFNFSFVFTSELFKNQIAEIFEQNFDIIPVTNIVKGKNMETYSLRFNCNRDRMEKMKIIYDWFYKDSTVFLKRKKDKFIEYFNYLNTEITSEITKGSEAS